MIGWAWEGRSTEAQVEAGWAGVMTLPRVLSLTEVGRLVSEPIPELRSLRKEHQSIPDQKLGLNQEVLLPLHGDCLEISMELEGTAYVAGLKVYCSPDQEEETALVWDSLSGRLVIDRRKSSLSNEVVKDERSTFLEVEHVTLRVFLDRSILEVYANCTCMTIRVYPSRMDSQEVRLFCRQGIVRFSCINLWRMEAVWPHNPGLV